MCLPPLLYDGLTPAYEGFEKAKVKERHGNPKQYAEKQDESQMVVMQPGAGGRTTARPARVALPFVRVMQTPW